VNNNLSFIIVVPVPAPQKVEKKKDNTTIEKIVLIIAVGFQMC